MNEVDFEGCTVGAVVDDAEGGAVKDPSECGVIVGDIIGEDVFAPIGLTHLSNYSRCDKYWKNARMG